VRDTAGGFLSENTFCGVAAFSRKTNLGNGQDGFLITATGGDIVIKIGNIISRNGDDGIEISGNARDVQAVQNMIGLDTSGFLARGNADNGIEIGGNAHDIVVGGAQPDFSIVPTGTISANGGYGVAVLGTAYDNQINFSYIGTDSHGRAGDSVILGNIKGGVFLGPGTRSTTIGSTDSSLHTVISGNRGDGITMSGTIANVVIGTRIGADTDGNALRNHGNGILIQNSSNNLIGGTIAGAGNIIAFNHRNGVFVESGQRNTLRQNSIYDNHGLGILLGPGANADQAAPVLTSAVSVLGGIQIFGTLTSTPGTTFTIELFASTSDGSRPAQGQTFLAAVTVSTEEFGFA
jgi:hypothetical protein